MTTIAYSARHRSIAADRLSTTRGIRLGYTRKIDRIGPVFLSGCGSGALTERFMDWVREGMHDKCPAMSIGSGPDDMASTGFLFLDELCLAFIGDGLMQHAFAPFFAYGSGGEIALGALATGASPEDAVRAAIQFDISSGGDIDVLTLP